MATKKQVEARNQEKERGRQPRPAAGNFKSVLNAIQHVQDKVHAQTAKDLEDYYLMMEELAKGKGDFAKAGIKDRVMAIKFHLDMADKFLNDYYETEDEESSESGETLEKVESKANGTNGLICLDFNSED